MPAGAFAGALGRGFPAGVFTGAFGVTAAAPADRGGGLDASGATVAGLAPRPPPAPCGGGFAGSFTGAFGAPAGDAGVAAAPAADGGAGDAGGGDDGTWAGWGLWSAPIGAAPPPAAPALVGTWPGGRGRVPGGVSVTAVGVLAPGAFAGGALSGAEERHPTGVPSVPPIASGPTYAADVRNAHRFDPLVEAGHAASLIELALRFAISSEAMTTVLVGTSTLDQLETAIRAVEKGRLPADALAAIARA